MRKGRLTQKEHERRLKLLLEFIFIFRYATVYEISEFSRLVIGITYARWLIYYASKRGLIRSYFEPLYRIKIYYLTAIGKGLIYEQEALIEHYNFEKKHTGVNAFSRHRLIVNAYLSITSRIELNLMNWKSDWILRIGKKKREQFPASDFAFPNGTKVAIELILEYKRPAFLKELIYSYYYLIEKIQKYHALLIIAYDRNYCEILKKKISFLAPTLCQKYAIFSDPETLKAGLCIYRDGVKPIKEIVDLLNAGALIHDP